MEIGMSSYPIATRYRAMRVAMAKFPEQILLEQRLVVALGLILVAALVMLTMMASAQAAFDQVMQKPIYRDFSEIRSSLQADYTTWEPTVFQPIMPEIIDELSRTPVDELGSIINFAEPVVIDGSTFVAAKP
jgi:hypothetical protein